MKNPLSCCGKQMTNVHSGPCRGELTCLDCPQQVPWVKEPLGDLSSLALRIYNTRMNLLGHRPKSLYLHHFISTHCPLTEKAKEGSPQVTHSQIELTDQRWASCPDGGLLHSVLTPRWQDKTSELDLAPKLAVA